MTVNTVERRILRVREGQPLPDGWELVEWLGVETNLLYGPTGRADVIYAERRHAVPSTASKGEHVPEGVSG